jgi:hypothetical protein
MRQVELVVSELKLLDEAIEGLALDFLLGQAIAFLEPYQAQLASVDEFEAVVLVVFPDQSQVYLLIQWQSLLPVQLLSIPLRSDQ